MEHVESGRDRMIDRSADRSSCDGSPAHKSPDENSYKKSLGTFCRDGFSVIRRIPHALRRS
jgi:hypothetical protein